MEPSTTDPTTTTTSTENMEDDASTGTQTIDNQAIPYEGEEKEYTLKFLFRPKASKNTNVAKNHYAILQAMLQVFPEIILYNNHGEVLNPKKLKTILNYNDYLRNFNLNFSKGNAEKNRAPIYIVVHRIRSRIPVSHIRRHNTIFHILSQGRAKMTVHGWSEDEIRISNIGFFVGFDPTNILNDDMEEWVRKQIFENTGTSLKKIPKFRCGFSSPFLVDDDDNRFSTKTFDLQCRQQDAREMIELLSTTFNENPPFMFHRVRHSNPDTYRRAILRQNSYLKKCRVVPIEGLSTDMLWYGMRSHITSIAGVRRVTKHKDTAEKGRWNIHTDMLHFSQVVTAVKENLSRWSEEVCEANTIQTGYSFLPRLAFKKNKYYEDDDDDESRASSFQTYMSACSSLYNADDEDCMSPPSDSAPVAQAWVCPIQIKTVVAGQKMEEAQSQITQDDYDKLKLENDKLTREIRELKDQFKQFMEDQRKARNSNASSQEQLDLKALLKTAMAEMREELSAIQANNTNTVNNSEGNRADAQEHANNDSEQGAASNLDASMAQANLSFGADESLMQSSMFSHDSVTG